MEFNSRRIVLGINMAAISLFSKDNMTAMTSFRKTLGKITMREPVGKKVRK